MSTVLEVGEFLLTRVLYVDALIDPDAVGLTPDQVVAVDWGSPDWAQDGQVRAASCAWVISRGGRHVVVDPSGNIDEILHDPSTTAAHQAAYADAIVASQPRLPFDTIESDLAARLLQTNGIGATVTEANAAIGVAQAFLAGADVTQDTPWRPEHGRLATARLVEWIATQQKSRPAREVREVTQVKWPEPVERMESRPPADRQLITNSAQFTRGYPYRGWVRSVYEVNAFDAYSTEFLLAGLFDSSPGVKAWVRIDQTVPLRVTYLMGAVQREYEPDFIVIDDANVDWIVEGKRDSEMTDPVVLAKKDATHAWVAAVNASTNVAQKWGYVLASESVISAASTWNALRSGAGAFAS